MSETLMFLETLYQRSADGWISLTAIHPTDDCSSPSRHIELGDIDNLQAALGDLREANKDGWGAYVGIGLRHECLGRWRRGGKQDVAELPALYVDLDTPDQMVQLIEVQIPPSCIVSSGRGMHVYWYIEPTRNLSFADRILAGMTQLLDSDSMTVAQSMRLPGFVNTKSDCGKLCVIKQHQPERVYTLQDFSRFAIARQRPTPPPPNARPTIERVTEHLLYAYDGYMKPNGWMAARCPLEHCRDRPGMHFNFHPEFGVGHCFGRHGSLSLGELCDVLGIRVYTAEN